jgi:phosphoserine phosphatase
MKKVNAIDLDKTLIPFDSFREYLFLNINLGNFVIIAFYMFLRKTRIIKMDFFKKKIIQVYRNNTEYRSNMKGYAEKLYNSIDSHILELVHSNTDSETVNVLISASPVDYVKELSTLLEWGYIASSFQGNDFVHAYGINKIVLLKSQYNPDQFKYNFAISDHDSDNELLSLFKNSAKVINNKVVER